MSRQANKTVIGIFVVGAIALVVIAVLILGSGKFFKKTFTAVCYFEGSVGGLNVGAPVIFRGVKVGSVKNIVLQFDPEKLTQTWVSNIPLGRVGEPEEIVGPALFLASDASSMVTGIILPVDGGYLAR
jgi:sporulation protein YlmC with PRC-barrel domain